MTDEKTWRSFEFLAEALQKKYPKTDLMFLFDDRLAEMLISLKETKDFPPLPKDKKERADICRCIKISWSRVMAGVSALDMTDNVSDD